MALLHRLLHHASAERLLAAVCTLLAALMRSCAPAESPQFQAALLSSGGGSTGASLVDLLCTLARTLFLARGPDVDQSHGRAALKAALLWALAGCTHIAAPLAKQFSAANSASAALLPASATLGSGAPSIVSVPGSPASKSPDGRAPAPTVEEPARDNSQPASARSSGATLRTQTAAPPRKSSLQALKRETFAAVAWLLSSGIAAAGASAGSPSSSVFPEAELGLAACAAVEVLAGVLPEAGLPFGHRILLFGF